MLGSGLDKGKGKARVRERDKKGKDTTIVPGTGNEVPMRVEVLLSVRVAGAFRVRP